MIHVLLPHETQPRVREISTSYTTLAPVDIGGISMLGVVERTVEATVFYTPEEKDPRDMYDGSLHLSVGGGDIWDYALAQAVVNKVLDIHRSDDWWSLMRNIVGNENPIMDALEEPPRDVCTLTCAEIPGVKYSFYNNTGDTIDPSLYQRLRDAFTSTYSEIRAEGDDKATFEYAFVLVPPGMKGQKVFQNSDNRKLVVMSIDTMIGLVVETEVSRFSKDLSDSSNNHVDQPLDVTIFREEYRGRGWGMAYPKIVMVKQLGARGLQAGLSE